ncbi:MAG: DegT/DnrJ/EryC1/StrS family aminotransferase, partial [Deltaproteobacteria bacterium]|nr:DegT/DnrJ/EryC1/StrS family aminotransferase [Deltaproteobacteria bacterium]
MAASPYYFGFFPGHWYLEDNQLASLPIGSSSPDRNEKVVPEFEARFAGLVGDGWCISFAAGRMAFYVLLKALGIGKGDEVILPAFTCSVMANAVWRTGATPVFSDIDLETFGSDAEAIERKITDRTKLVVAQHSFGIPCKIDRIVEIAGNRNIFVLEDCAITLDSSYKGIKVGNWGDAAIFSTDHSKPINTLTGGMLYTNNTDLFRKVRDEAKNAPHLDREQQERLIREVHAERVRCSPNRYARSKLSRTISSYANRLLARASR